MYAHRRIAILATACLRPLKLPLSLQPGGWAACKPLPTAIQIEGYIRRGGHKERPPPPRRQVAFLSLFPYINPLSPSRHSSSL